MLLSTAFEFFEFSARKLRLRAVLADFCCVVRGKFFFVPEIGESFLVDCTCTWRLESQFSHVWWMMIHDLSSQRAPLDWLCFDFSFNRMQFSFKLRPVQLLNFPMISWSVLATCWRMMLSNELFRWLIKICSFHEFQPFNIKNSGDGGFGTSMLLKSFSIRRSWWEFDAPSSNCESLSGSGRETPALIRVYNKLWPNTSYWSCLAFGFLGLGWLRSRWRHYSTFLRSHDSGAYRKFVQFCLTIFLHWSSQSATLIGSQWRNSLGFQKLHLILAFNIQVTSRFAAVFFFWYPSRYFHISNFRKKRPSVNLKSSHWQIFEIESLPTFGFTISMLFPQYLAPKRTKKASNWKKKFNTAYS